VAPADARLAMTVLGCAEFPASLPTREPLRRDRLYRANLQEMHEETPAGRWR
jgi:hypothetical protein